MAAAKITVMSRILLLLVFFSLVLGTSCNGRELRISQGLPRSTPTSLMRKSPTPEPGPSIDNSLTPGSTDVRDMPLVVPQEPYLGIWITKDKLASLPTSGPAWDQLKAAADQPAGPPDLSNKSQMNNVSVLAKALVYARTGEDHYRTEVIENLMEVMGTEDGGDTLALGRGLVAYVIAADLINLPLDVDEDNKFRAWLRDTLTETLSTRTLRSTHEDRPNNWGTHAGASRAAVALYLGDASELERTAQVFKGWLGDQSVYAGFEYGSLWWQADPKKPVGINPKGATKEGYSIDGALPEEMRRGGKFRWPPRETGYAWEALQGALVQAELLHQAGYPTWEWEDQALLRAVQFLYDIGWVPEGDDQWQPWLINYAYNTSLPATTPAQPGKNMGWTDWTHSRDGSLNDRLEGSSLHSEPFGTVTIQPDFELDGQGTNVDSIAFWEAPNPADTLMYVTAKENRLVEVWKYPFEGQERTPIQGVFGSGKVNGIALDRKMGLLYISQANASSTLYAFSITETEPHWQLEITFSGPSLGSEPNQDILYHASGQTWLYVTDGKKVHIWNLDPISRGAAPELIGGFTASELVSIETILADDYYQIIYLPDENGRTGIYAYQPDGTPYERNNTHRFGSDEIFQSDEEGILLYKCLSEEGSDMGGGYIVVADQKKDQTDFEFFDRQTWKHLGTLRFEGVSNTDGIASTQSPLPDYPLGIFAAVNDDKSTAGVGWKKIFEEAGLNCDESVGGN